MTASSHEAKVHETVIHIDGKEFKVTQDSMTATEILRLRFGSTADLSQKLLTLRHGNDIREFGDPKTPIPIEPGLHFVVLDRSPTTVS